jgi:hypothetical protein
MAALTMASGQIKNLRDRRRSPRRLVLVLAVVLGLFSSPVTCAVAAGPHSLFVDPGSAAQVFDAHAHHRAELAVESEDACCDGEARAEGASVSAAGLVSAVTVLANLAAVLPAAEAETLPTAGVSVSVSPDAPIPHLAQPETPPPR